MVLVLFSFNSPTPQCSPSPQPSIGGGVCSSVKFYSENSSSRFCFYFLFHLLLISFRVLFRVVLYVLSWTRRAQKHKRFNYQQQLLSKLFSCPDSRLTWFCFAFFSGELQHHNKIYLMWWKRRGRRRRNPPKVHSLPLLLFLLRTWPSSGMKTIWEANPAGASTELGEKEKTCLHILSVDSNVDDSWRT